MVKAPFTDVKMVVGQQKSHSKMARANSSTEKQEKRFKRSSRHPCMSNKKVYSLPGRSKKSDNSLRIGWRTYTNRVFVRELTSATRRLYDSTLYPALAIINSKNFRHNIF